MNKEAVIRGFLKRAEEYAKLQTATKIANWHIVYPSGKYIKKKELQERPKDADSDNGDLYTPWYNKIEHYHGYDKEINGGEAHPWAGSYHLKAKNLKEALKRAKKLKSGDLPEM